MKIRKQLTPRAIRYLVYLVMLLGLLAVDRLFPTRRSDLVVETPHYVIESSATREQMDEVGRMLELAHAAYCSFFSDLLPPAAARPQRLRAILYGNRAEFRRHNRSHGWAEAFYGGGACHAYYPGGSESPHHWMVHEAIHQLNTEVAQVVPVRWIEEGIAQYFAASRVIAGSLRPDRPDPAAYPVWWLDILATTGDIGADIANGSVIPLRQIVSGRGGPDIDTHFNLYYLHWWTLTHFLIHHDDGRYRAGFLALWKQEQGGFLPGFEEKVGPVGQIEPEWHAYVLGLKNRMREP